MTQRMSDERLEREIRRFLEWQADDLAGAPTEEEVIQRIVARRTAKRRQGGTRLVLAFAILGLLATATVGLVLTGGTPPPRNTFLPTQPLPVASTSPSATASAARTAAPVAREVEPSAVLDIGRLDPEVSLMTAGTVSTIRANGHGVWATVPEVGADGARFVGSRLLRIDPVTNELAPVIVGGRDGRLSSVAVGTDSLWASRGRELFRIDPDGRVTTFRMDRESLPEAVADEGVWVNTDAGLRLLDPSTADVVRELDVGGLVAFDSVWTWDDQGSDIERIDARTGDPIASIPVPPLSLRFGCGPEALTGVEGIGDAIIVRCVRVEEQDDVGIVRIDPATNRVVGTTEVGIHESWTVADGAWWFSRPPGWSPQSPTPFVVPDPLPAATLTRIDPSSGAVLDVVTVEAAETIRVPGPMAATADSLWFAGVDRVAVDRADGSETARIVRIPLDRLQEVAP